MRSKKSEVGGGEGLSFSLYRNHGGSGYRSYALLSGGREELTTRVNIGREKREKKEENQ